MRHFQAMITILLAFLLAPLAADYFVAPVASWGVGLLVIAYETWVLTFKKTTKDIAEENARLAAARRRVEQIKHEAAMMYLQPSARTADRPGSKFDVDNMSPVELANAARQIVSDIREKKTRKEGGAPGESMPKAA